MPVDTLDIAHAPQPNQKRLKYEPVERLRVDTSRRASRLHARYRRAIRRVLVATGLREAAAD
jgi:hypothetical protein